VIVVDHLEYRLDFVQRYTGCEILNFKEVQDMAEKIKSMTDWLGADVCIDCVGAEAVGNALQHLTGVKLKLQAGAATVLHWAINAVRKGGNPRVRVTPGEPDLVVRRVGDVLRRVDALARQARGRAVLRP
jgi:threonine dehydrogenase-like Zn-dependent dehydrogenase